MDSLAKQEVFIKFPDIEKLAVASSFLHTYLAPEVREKLSVEICATILSADPTFHEKLKEAHRSQNSEELENLCSASSDYFCTTRYLRVTNSLSQTKCMALSSSLTRDEPTDSHNILRWKDSANS